MRSSDRGRARTRSRRAASSCRAGAAKFAPTRETRREVRVSARGQRPSQVSLTTPRRKTRGRDRNRDARSESQAAPLAARLGRAHGEPAPRAATGACSPLSGQAVVDGWAVLAGQPGESATTPGEVCLRTLTCPAAEGRLGMELQRIIFARRLSVGISLRSMV